MPLMLSLGIGLCVNQTRAVFEALAGKETEFVRTPKHGLAGATSPSGKQLEVGSSRQAAPAPVQKLAGKKYKGAKGLMPFIEMGLACYFAFTMWVAFAHGHYLSLPFLLLFLCGFGYVGGLTLWQTVVGWVDALRRARLSRLGSGDNDTDTDAGSAPTVPAV